MRRTAQLPEVLHNRDFRLYLFGVVFSEVGVRGTYAVNLFHIYLLTNSTVQVGLTGLAQAAALLILAPLGGAIADRIDRRRVVQATQTLSLLVSLSLGLATVFELVAAWHIHLAVLLNTAAMTFETPARRALVPALVPRRQLPRAFALVHPAGQLAVLIGPALGGALVAVWGPQAMYLVDAATYLVLIVVMGLLKVPRLVLPDIRPPLLSSIAQGFVFVRGRPLIIQLMALDFVATFWGAYRVILPELAEDILQAGALGYGVLAAAPSAGSILSAVVIFKLIDRSRAGPLVLGATVLFGVSCIVLAQAPLFAVAVAGAVGIGAFDSLASTIRQSAVQLETPDDIRGRVSSLYQMAARSGPALGNANIGWFASFLGPAWALTAGGLVPITVAVAIVARRGRLTGYDMPREAV